MFQKVCADVLNICDLVVTTTDSCPADLALIHAAVF